jgi:hypothetical protein
MWKQKTVSQKFWHRPNLREWWVGEKLIGKAIANALPCLDDDVEEAKETTMVEGWRGLKNLKFGTLSEFEKCEAVVSTCQKPVQDRPTPAS